MPIKVDPSYIFPHWWQVRQVIIGNGAAKSKWILSLLIYYISTFSMLLFRKRVEFKTPKSVLKMFNFAPKFYYLAMLNEKDLNFN